MDKFVKAKLIVVQMKTVIATLIIAGITQLIICRIPGLEYSGAVDGFLTIEWLVGSLLLGFNAPSRRLAYLCSVGLSVPAISYSMVGYGFLEMGGYVHALLSGIVGLVFYAVIQSFKQRKVLCNSVS
ncbi:MAG TPA: hypothetical protein VHG71_09765 [Verrucomicrobiae bacterium]|nr:hypothetical protein [Verrucomicrobiae bacterium]